LLPLDADDAVEKPLLLSRYYLVGFYETTLLND